MANGKSNSQTYNAFGKETVSVTISQFQPTLPNYFGHTWKHVNDHATCSPNIFMEGLRLCLEYTKLVNS